jgi:hypothetical protein
VRVGDGARAVVLVEGESDRAALHALAGRRGRSLPDEGIEVVAMGGITNLRRFLGATDVPVAGLYDAGEERHVRRGLAAAGLDDIALTREGMEAAGFYVCIADLEDELIRSLGPEAVLRIVAGEGELGSFRTLQKQAPHRGRSAGDQLHRFMGTRGGRKVRYARLLVEALDLDRVPRPLDCVLDHATNFTVR